ncbi:MAG: rhodanese-like domain-containing protein [Acidimicrobiia bacterium]|nr:rhodanese-like domain-containing protein [Acidimicrobiia bacterium]
MTAITTDELARRVDDPDSAPFILDVRAPDQFERWQIEGKADMATLNIPYWTAIVDDEETREVVPHDREVVVVCAHGDSSDLVVETLGLDNLHNLAGGMDAWARTLVPHVLYDDGTKFVVQLDRIAKACLSYAVGSRGSSMAVIDPAGDASAYERIAADMECEITDVFDTHLHADHLSLGVQMAAEFGATYHIAPGDAEGAHFKYDALTDGAVFQLGTMQIIVRSVATPGHTPGSTSLEVDGRYLMTGDAVFVSGVGRPDLGGETEPWARDLFRTIHEQLAPLDSELEVCPAHYTSRLESQADGTLRRKLGDLLANDPVVSMDDEGEFVAYVVSHLGEAPGVYATIREVNMGWHIPTHDEAMELEVGRNECALSE